MCWQVAWGRKERADMYESVGLAGMSWCGLTMSMRAWATGHHVLSGLKLG